MGEEERKNLPQLGIIFQIKFLLEFRPFYFNRTTQAKYY